MQKNAESGRENRTQESILRASASRARFPDCWRRFEAEISSSQHKSEIYLGISAGTEAVPASQTKGFSTEGKAAGRKPERLAQPPQITKREESL